MRITRLSLRDFRRHTELELELAPGLTVVRGPNEAGKSTVQQAIEAALFVKAESESQATRELWRWGATEPPLVELEFEADGSKGRLTKRFGGSKGSGELAVGNELIHDPTAIQERIHTLTGIPNESFFRSTASVGHAELARVGGGEPLIQDRLQKAVSGADRGTAAAKKKLAATIQRYRSEGNVNPGRLKVVREEVTHLAGELASGERALEQLEADRARWVEARDKRLLLDERLEREKEELADAQRAEAMAARRDEMQARYERAKRGAELRVREAELQRLSPTDIPLAELRSAVRRASSLSLDLSELEAELSVPGGIDATEGAGRGPRPWPWVGLAVASALAGGLSWILLDGLLGVAALAVLSVVTLVLLVQSVRVAFRARQFVLAQDLARHAVADRQQADRAHQDSFRRKQHELEAQLASLGVPSAEAAEALLAAAEAHGHDMAEIVGELRGLGIGDASLGRLEAERDDAANGADQAAHALAALGEIAADPSGIRQRSQAQVDRTSSERDAAKSDEDQALGRVEANDVDSENVAILAERLAAAQAREAQLQRNLRIYQGTLEAIEAAEKATLKTAARYLEERMGPAISRITEGRYSEVVVSESDLAIRVRSPEASDLVGAEQLSRGAADQLYLAARLGLIRLVTMDRRPPLVLDDPFVTFDAPRARRSISILREVAAEQGVQILFLSWSDRYDLEADKVIQLAAPPVVASRAVVPDPVPPTGPPQVAPSPTLPDAPGRPAPAVTPASDLPWSRGAGSDGGPSDPEADPVWGFERSAPATSGQDASGAAPSGTGASEPPQAGAAPPGSLWDQMRTRRERAAESVSEPREVSSGDPASEPRREPSEDAASEPRGEPVEDSANDEPEGADGPPRASSSDGSDGARA